MVTHKRGTVAWLFTAAVLLAFSTIGFAQDGDANESGYTSKYLANLNKSKLGQTDAAKARQEAMKERFGTARAGVKTIVGEAQKQKQTYGGTLLPGGHAPAGTPVWQSLGPTKTNHIQNGISLNVVNSGRMRSILPNPTNADPVYP